jgi:hypothetical protein
MTALIAVLTLHISVEAHSTELSEKTKEIVSGIEENGCYVYAFLGIPPPQPSPQWIRYLSLSSHATSDELVLLTDHVNPAVRCYAFLLLAKRKDPRICEILRGRLSDTQEVSTLAGCFAVIKPVRDVFREIAGPTCPTEDLR